MTERDRTGQFKRGVSGNPNGRPSARPAEMKPADLHRIIMKVASRPTSLKSGDNKTVTLFEANVMSLGTGSAANRLAARAFIELAQDSARRLEIIRSEQDRQEAIARRDAEMHRRMHPSQYHDETD